MGDTNNELNNNESGVRSKRLSKIRDVWSDRIVAIFAGALAPVLVMLIPLVNKWLDNSKEIQTLQIQSNTDNIEQTNSKVDFLTEALISSQIQTKTLSDKLADSIKSLVECEKNCDTYCNTTIKPKK